MGLKNIINDAKLVLSGIKHNVKDSYHYFEYNYFPTDELKGDLIVGTLNASASALIFHVGNTLPQDIFGNSPPELSFTRFLIFSSVSFGLFGLVDSPGQYFFDLFKHKFKQGYNDDFHDLENYTYQTPPLNNLVMGLNKIF